MNNTIKTNLKTVIPCMMFIAGLLITTTAQAMNKAELVDAMASGASISLDEADLIYDSLIEELTSAAQSGGVDFEPFGIIAAESIDADFYANVTVLRSSDSETFTGHVTITKSGDERGRKKQSRDSGRIESNDISVVEVDELEIPANEILQNVTLIDAKADKKKPKKKSKEPKEYVGHVTLLRGSNIGSSSLDGVSLADEFDEDTEKKEFVGHVTLLRAKRGDKKEYVGHVTLLRNSTGGYDYQGHVTLTGSAYVDSFFDIYFRTLIDLTLREAKIEANTPCQSAKVLKVPDDCLKHRYEIDSLKTARTPSTGEFELEASLALVYKKRIDKATPLLSRALNCDGANESCDWLWDEVETLLIKLGATGTADQTIYFREDGTPVRATVSLTPIAAAVWTAGVHGYIDKGREISRAADTQPPPVTIVSWGVILERVSSSTGFQTEMVALSLKAMGEAAAGALAGGDTISLAGFGSFSISNRAARTGRNPQTGKEIQIAAKNVVRFKAGADLSKKVN